MSESPTNYGSNEKRPQPRAGLDERKAAQLLLPTSHPLGHVGWTAVAERVRRCDVQSSEESKKDYRAATQGRRQRRERPAARVQGE